MNNTLNKKILTNIKEIPTKRIWKGDINIPIDLLGKFNEKLKKTITKNILKYSKELNHAELLLLISKNIVATAILFHSDKAQKKPEFKKEVDSLDKDVSNIFTKCSDEVINKHYSATLGSEKFKENRYIIKGEGEYFSIVDNVVHEIIYSKHGKSTDCYCMSYDLLRQCSSIFSILVNIFETIINLKDSKMIKDNYSIIAKCKLIPKVKCKYADLDGANKNIELTRPITSCPLIFRILDIYMSQKIKSFYMDNKLLDNTQMVYQKNGLLKANHGVIDYIRSIKDNSGKAIVFKDIKDAYSAVIHQKLIDIMHKDDVPMYIINYYNNFLNNLNMYTNNPSDFFRMFNGILQGQNSSQILFIIYMNRYIQDIKSLMNDCMHINKSDKNDFLIAYVDDLTFKIKSKIFLKKLFATLPVVNNKFNFKFGLSKSKKIIDKSTYVDTDFIYEGYQIDDVYIEMKYLGGYIYPNSKKLFVFLKKIMITDLIKQIKEKSLNRTHSLAMLNKHVINMIIQKFSKSNIEIDVRKINDIMFDIGLYLYQLDFDNIVTICLSIKIMTGFWKRYTSSGIYVFSDEKQEIINSISGLEEEATKLSNDLDLKTRQIVMSKSAYGKTFAYDAIF